EVALRRPTLCNRVIHERRRFEACRRRGADGGHRVTYGHVRHDRELDRIESGLGQQLRELTTELRVAARSAVEQEGGIERRASRMDQEAFEVRIRHRDESARADDAPDLSQDSCRGVHVLEDEVEEGDIHCVVGDRQRRGISLLEAKVREAVLSGRSCDVGGVAVDADHRSRRDPLGQAGCDGAGATPDVHHALAGFESWQEEGGVALGRSSPERVAVEAARPVEVCVRHRRGTVGLGPAHARRIRSETTRAS
ncbi:MAG: hypothetical protein AVDCRST_MAG50-207, partial [uncultured Acidimicrobiales bacterium]